MKGTVIKRILACVLFCALTVFLIVCFNDLLVIKTSNRYYMMDRKLAELDGEFDVQIYGSCHAYTSFDSMILEEEYGVSTYNLAQAGEIIPVTYVRMQEQFRKYAPEVALVEIWGVNPYETYITTESIINDYMLPNVSQIDFSPEKVELIRLYDSLDMLAENFPIAKYKDRLMDFSLNEADFNYSLETVAENAVEGTLYVGKAMAKRFANNGYLRNDTEPLADYDLQQGDSGGESLAVEEEFMLYIDKIIALCEEYDVQLIFYRAPYRATDNELKKVNYLKEYFGERDIPFFDLEEEIDFDPACDFNDYEHLSESGARKATEYLVEYILPCLE